MPHALIYDELKSGRLVQLDIADGKAFQYPLFVIHRSDEEPGPAGRWLMQQFFDLDHSLPHGAY
jgi:DNA-binding transcriptional LysR family regulator